VPVAVGPPHDVHCTPLTNRVPSPVSSKDAGRCRPRPTTPSNDTVPVVVVDVVSLVVVDVVEAVAVGVVDCVAVLVTGVEAVFVTVFVVDPHDASASSAPAASRPRPITRGSYGAPDALDFERALTPILDVMATGAGLTITDATRLSGVSPYTLRYYERAGLIDEVVRAGSSPSSNARLQSTRRT
jgi:hypothetical protein